MKHRPRRAGMRNRCPHCGHYAAIRTSESVSRTCRHGLIECSNAECGWRGTVQVALIETRTPSMAPSPKVDIPLSAVAAERLNELFAAQQSKSQDDDGCVIRYRHVQPA